MRATCNVEKQAVGPARLIPGRDERRIAKAPQAQFLEGRGIRGRIGVARLQIEHFRAGVGQEIPRDETTTMGGAVQCDNARAAFSGSDQNERPMRVDGVSRRGGGLRLQQACYRPRLQPNRNDARHGSTR